MTHPIHPSFDQTGKSGSLHPGRAAYDEKTRFYQDRFLNAFPQADSIEDACHQAGIESSTMYDWRKDDVQGFYAKWLLARQQHADYLESLAVKRVKNPSFGGRIGSDVLLIALNNAYNEHWRPKVTVQHELGARVLEALRQAQGRDRSAGLGYGALTPELAPGRVVEAEAVERPPEEEKG